MRRKLTHGSTFGMLAATVSLLVTISVLAADEGPAGTPDVTLDLMTSTGVEAVGGQWRYSDVRIVEVPFRDAGPGGQPTGKANVAYDYEPKAGVRDFDDSSWTILDPADVNVRRTAGKVSFNWYRIRLTVPASFGDFQTAGSTIVFETSVDDYAEIWVDGELPRSFPQSGGSVIKGWNDINRLVIGRDVKPGQEIQISVFGINGPISASPTNYIFMRMAKLHFHRGVTGPLAVVPHEVNVNVIRLDPRIDDIVPENAKIIKLAEGFEFIEGPIWRGDGSLLFSDPNANRIYRYTPNGQLRVFMEQSGYSGTDIDKYRQPGSNGLTLDAEARLTICEHGNRQVRRLEPDGSFTVLANQYNGRRLNSPNDLTYRSDGWLYFTDPPFGLPKFDNDPNKELPFSGIFRAKDGRVELLNSDLKGPNGIGFSPDERFLYVGNWDVSRKVVMRYPVNADGQIGDGTVFFDMTAAPGEEAIDGVKTDNDGNVYVSGPGGLWILSPRGEHLGTIVGPKLSANFTWGDADGRTLYMTARSGLYSIRLKVAGYRPAMKNTSR